MSMCSAQSYLVMLCAKSRQSSMPSPSASPTAQPHSPGSDFSGLSGHRSGRNVSVGTTPKSSKDVVVWPGASVVVGAASTYTSHASPSYRGRHSHTPRQHSPLPLHNNTPSASRTKPGQSSCPTQWPDMHASPVVHASPSSQVRPSTTGMSTHRPPSHATFTQTGWPGPAQSSSASHSQPDRPMQWPRPSHDSSTRHSAEIPEATLHSVPRGWNLSGGQRTLIPSQYSTTSQPWLSLLLPKGPGSVATSSRHTTVFGSTRSSGQCRDSPVHRSATSHSKVAGRHSVSAGKNSSGGQDRSYASPEQTSGASHKPSAGRQVAFAGLIRSAGHSTVVPSQNSGTSQVTNTSPSNSRLPRAGRHSVVGAAGWYSHNPSARLHTSSEHGLPS
mmetsp:Transcript_2377/g.7591  ORF Transcript_2377/g.7591 Transcript_2377/m.7591 type:complete len:387 (+) Transcript_2377:1527-2687(+)